MVSLKRFLEIKYKISIPDEDASPDAFDTVNKIVDLVNAVHVPVVRIISRQVNDGSLVSQGVMEGDTDELQ